VLAVARELVVSHKLERRAARLEGFSPMGATSSVREGFQHCDRAGTVTSCLQSTAASGSGEANYEGLREARGLQTGYSPVRFRPASLGED